MTQLDYGTTHPAARERLSPKDVERLLAMTLVTVQMVWLGLLGLGVKWVIFG